MVKLIVSLFVYAWDVACGLWTRVAGRRRPCTCVVIYYHSVNAAERGRFARQMDIVASLAQAVRSDGEISAAHGQRYCAVTFDDVFQNILENALPEMAKRAMPCTLFVASGRMGELAEWWPDTNREHQERLASAAELRALSSDLVVIGSHTVHHPVLTDLDENLARWELVESRCELERILGRPVTVFSFPNGVFNEALVAWCQDAGYERVFTTLPVLAFREPDEFVTGRVKVDPTDSPLEFRLKVLGAYRWLPYAYAAKRRVLSLLAPRRRHGAPSAA